MELLARLYDHAKKEFSYGFRMLTLCWSDGNTLLPVSHTLLSAENAKNHLRDGSQKADARSTGGKQRKLAQQKATEVMLLLQEAKATAIQARHVLFDTWFCSPASLLNIHGLGYGVVAMAKKTEKIHDLHFYALLRQQLENDGTIIDGVFQKDYEFKSPPAAADVVKGHSVNGNEAWKTGEGTKLKDL